MRRPPSRHVFRDRDALVHWPSRPVRRIWIHRAATSASSSLPRNRGPTIIGTGTYAKPRRLFAAEFIYPEVEFAAEVAALGVACWDAESIALLKRGCRAKVSYQFLCKRFARLGLIGRDQYDGVQFRKLEEQMFGVPFYRR